jgi:hypothetical protein
LKGFQPAHLISAFVDPRSKVLPMFDDVTKSGIRAMVKEEMAKYAPVSAKKSISVDPQSKSLKAAIFDCDMSDMDDVTVDDDLDNELNRYLTASKLPYFYLGKDKKEKMNNPLDWWRIHSSDFPTLAILAKKYLCTPATSAPVERLFSRAGLTITEKRNRLADDIAADLIFLNANWEKLKFGEEDGKTNEEDVVQLDSDVEIIENTK